MDGVHSPIWDGLAMARLPGDSRGGSEETVNCHSTLSFNREIEEVSMEHKILDIAKNQSVRG
jgi:hypothetical protein